MGINIMQRNFSRPLGKKQNG